MENIPKDRYNIVCIAFYLMGVGTLMPWNLFINGKYSNDISNYYKIEKKLKTLMAKNFHHDICKFQFKTIGSINFVIRGLDFHILMTLSKDLSI